MRRPLALLALGCALGLAACEDLVRGRVPPAPDLDAWTIVEGFDPQAPACACGGARQMYLRNGRNYARTIGVVESATNIFTNEAAERSLPAQSVGGLGRRLLGCSRVTVNATCDTYVSYRLEAPQASLAPKTAITRRALPLGPLRFAQISTGPLPPLPLDCKQECLGGSSPGARCLAADNTDKGHHTPEHRLLAAVGDIGRDGVGARPDLLAAWGKTEADEPCGRGDVVIRDGALFNGGSPCEFPGAFAGPGTGVRVTLPAGVVGRYDRQPSGFSIDFSNPATAPTLAFDNTYLNLEFGGAIRRIEQAQGHFVVTAPRACLALKL